MTEAILFILLTFAFLYLLQTAFIFVGTGRLTYSRTRELPEISVLVALRNEAKTLRPCVESLLGLDYPQEKLEIILINDRSRDATPQILEEFTVSSAVIKTVHITQAIRGLSGKANAIAQGIEQASGELILVTDGDCRVPKTWAQTHVSYFTERVGLVGGFTLLDEKHDKTSLFGKVQSLDWAYLLSIGSGAIGFGIPLSVLGNNFAFRRKTYDQVGGYRNMGFTIIEDFALMKTLLKKTDWQVCYPIDPEMTVYSHPMPDFRAFYHQRKRWSAGGKEVGFYGKFLMFLSHVIHIFLPLSFFFLQPLYPAVALLAILASDFLLLLRTTGMAGRRDLLKYFPLWQMFYFTYTTFFAPVLLFPTTVKWKDMAYSWKLNFKMKKIVDQG